MEIISNSSLANPMTLFSLGTVFGATSAYYLFHIRKKIQSFDPPMAVPIEERYNFPELLDEYRLVMAIRSDLKMQKGKVAAQCGHASVAAYAKTLQNDPELLQRWLQYGGTKITVRVDSEKELMELDKSSKAHNVLSCIIRDAGHTQVVPGSKTVIAIGPAQKSILDKITGHLKLY